MPSASIDFCLDGCTIKLMTGEVSSVDLSLHWQQIVQTSAPLAHQHTKTGRPFLPNQKVDISLAHTESSPSRYSFLLGAVNAPGKIGVDLESSSRVMSPFLQGRLKKINPDAEPLASWTLLEAFAKCTDKKMSLETCQLIPLKLERGFQQWAYVEQLNGEPVVQVKGWLSLVDGHYLAIAIDQAQRV